MAAYMMPKPLEIGDKVIIKIASWHMYHSFTPAEFKGQWIKGEVIGVYPTGLGIQLAMTWLDGVDGDLFLTKRAQGIMVIRYVGRPNTNPAKLLALRLAYRAKTAKLAELKGQQKKQTI